MRYISEKEKQFALYMVACVAVAIVGLILSHNPNYVGL